MKTTRIDGVDTRVTKYVFEFSDAIAEAVLYRYPTYEERTVICCSTQCGCPIGCTFCGTGANFIRSLTSTEIYKQVFAILENQKIDATKINRFQIMFMSMGEPFLNLQEVITACEKLHTVFPLAELLISTSAPRISRKRWDEFLLTSQKISQIGLQFSVHESTDEARGKLIPFQGKMSLMEISKAGKEWFDCTGRPVFFNYCATKNNTSNEDAQRLLELFDPSVWKATISVVCEKDETVAASVVRQAEMASEFSGKLVALGFDTRVFNPAGQDDIGGGCGQLWATQKWMKNHK
jgi:23S rRNA (adenine2503-C2)-methyltransferase